MHRVHRQILVTCLCLLSLIITCNRCHRQEIAHQQLLIEDRSEWTPMMEMQVRRMLYTQSGKFTSDSAERSAYVECCMEKIHQLFPDTVPSMQTGVSDSLLTAMGKIGQDCAVAFKKEQQPWQPVVVEQLKLRFYSLPEIKLLPQSAQKEYVDCLMYGVIAKFPNGLKAGSKDSLKAYMLQQRKNCIKLIANKYSKLTRDKLKIDSTK
jgi:hypothetical protein